jgi:mRNA-degrading endonuclease RelE of RelBE toxin-antitoxin system
MRWALHYSRAAVAALYQRVAREDARLVRSALQMLIEDPAALPLQPSEEDPSIFWIAVPGDYLVYFEIIDERRIVYIINIV